MAVGSTWSGLHTFELRFGMNKPVRDIPEFQIYFSAKPYIPTRKKIPPGEKNLHPAKFFLDMKSARAAPPSPNGQCADPSGHSGTRGRGAAVPASQRTCCDYLDYPDGRVPAAGIIRRPASGLEDRGTRAGA
jgi:hypothetical protein